MPDTKAESMARRLEGLTGWNSADEVDLHTEAAALIREQAAEIADLKANVVGFVAVQASEQGRWHYGDPLKLHARHYDLLKRCGARMDDFIRMEAP